MNDHPYKSVPNRDNQAALTAFRSNAALIAWIDILGFSGLPDEKMEEILRFFGHVSSFLSGNGPVLKLTPEKKVNALMIGDALCVTQTSDNTVNRHAVITVALQFSKSLFALQLPHRGVLVEGSVRCGPEFSDLRGGSYITGQGVVAAYRSEQKQKFIGITVAENLREDATQWTNAWTGAEIKIISTPANQHFVTNDQHFERWTSFIEGNSKTHPYAEATKAMLAAIEIK